METSSNTGDNRKPGTFVKGDKRINRKGRPRNFDKLRDLAQLISHEVVKNPKTGEEATVIEAILRQWASSKDPREKMKFVEIAYGNAPIEQKHTGSVEQRHSGAVTFYIPENGRDTTAT